MIMQRIETVQDGKIIFQMNYSKLMVVIIWIIDELICDYVHLLKGY